MKHVCVYTDGEPDDYKAVWLLHKCLKKGLITSLKFVVTSWNDPYKKAQIFKSIIRKYGDYPVYYGEETDKNYDMTGLEQFINEELEILKYSTDQLNDVDTVFALAPPIELIKLYQDNPDIFKNKCCYMYGSFNVRYLVEKGFYKFDEITEMFKSFNSVYWYECIFATGNEKSFTDEIVFNNLNKVFPEFLKLIKWWNDKMSEEHLNNLEWYKKSLESESDLKKREKLTFGVERSQKIINNINECPHQIVNADAGCVIYAFYGNSHLEAIPSDVKFDIFTRDEFNPESNIFVIKHKNFNKENAEESAANVRAEQLTYYKNLLDC
jgi:hypothetical protein